MVSGRLQFASAFRFSIDDGSDHEALLGLTQTALAAVEAARGAVTLKTTATVSRASTLDNLSLDELAADVTAAFAAIGADVHASVAGGTLLLQSATIDVTIGAASVNADLLGVTVPATSVRDPSEWRVIAEDALATVGVLADNVALYISMAQADPNDDPERIAPDLPADAAALREIMTRLLAWCGRAQCSGLV